MSMSEIYTYCTVQYSIDYGTFGLVETGQHSDLLFWEQLL